MEIEDNLTNDEKIDRATLLPLFQMLEGVWEGVQKIFDSKGILIEEKNLKSTYSMNSLTLNETTYNYHRVDEFLQNDITTERKEYVGYYSNKRIWFMDIDSDHTKFNEKPISIDGWLGQILKDPHHRTLISYWEILNEPQSRVYSFTIVNEDSRTLNISTLWYNDGLLFKQITTDQIKIN